MRQARGTKNAYRLLFPVAFVLISSSTKEAQPAGKPRSQAADHINGYLSKAPPVTHPRHGSKRSIIRSRRSKEEYNDLLCCRFFTALIAGTMIGIIQTATWIKPLQYSEIDHCNTSPTLKEDLKSEYHYYTAFFWSPRILILIIGIWKTGIFHPVLII